MFADGYLLQQSNRKPAISGGREVVWACPTAPRMSLINKLSFRESFLALASLLLFFFLPTSAQAVESLNFEFNPVTQLLEYNDNPPGNLPGGTMCLHTPRYNGSYPDETSIISTGGLQCGWRNDPWSDMFDYLNTIITNNIATATSGDYWIAIDMYNCTGGTPATCTPEYEPDYYLNLNVFNGQVTAVVTSQTLTRHLDLTATSTAGVVTYTSEYFLNISEFTSQYLRPDTLFINVSNQDTTQADQIKQLILPLEQGEHSVDLVSTETLPDGIYTAQVNFWNFTENRPVFNSSYITLNFTLTSGVISYSEIVSSESAIYPGIPRIECSFSNIPECAASVMSYLFVPPQYQMQMIIAQVLDSEIAIITPAIQAFSEINGYATGSTTPSTTTLAYSLRIPEADIDVEMFSVDRMTYLMGDTTDTFRNIIQVALWLGFLAMLISSVNKMFTVTETNKQV